MEPLVIKLEGKREHPQWIEVLVPLRHLPFNPNVCGHCHCLKVGYSDEEPPLEERIFLDTWDINSSKD
jgi:hypothetical protein